MAPSKNTRPAPKKSNQPNKKKTNQPARPVQTTPRVQAKPSLPPNSVITYKEGMTVLDLAEALNRTVPEVIRKLMFMKIMASQTQTVDRETAELLILDYGYVMKDETKSDMTKFEDLEIIDDPKNLVERPPVVTIMGHVDHGKTTLLDTIRHTRVVQTEAGGITQHIGAYQIMRGGKAITFIDTPGHAAFTEMRARGAKVTDIIVLVVAADDGVMPQTKEAIDHAKAAKVSIIVAVNKMDKPGVNPERVKQELADLDLLPDDWGGSTPYCYISALKGTGVDNLLDTIQLVAEMQELKANPKRAAIGTVVEAKLDKGKGPVATILVDNGTLRVGDHFVVGTTYGKIRAMNDDLGRQLAAALPATPVEITGLSDVPYAGDALMVFADERTAKDIAAKRALASVREEKGIDKMLTLEQFFKKAESNEKELRLIVKADTQGSIEAFKGALEKIKVPGTSIDIVRAGVGAITDTDVLLAEASKAIILGFDVRPQAQVRDSAATKNIEIRLYNIIYEALDDVEKAMKGLLDPVYEKQVLGEAIVRTTFSISKVGTIAGCMVVRGSIRRDALVKVVREGKTVFEGKIASLKRFKDDAKEVKMGFECGIMIEGFNDLREDDTIEASIMQEVKDNA